MMSHLFNRRMAHSSLQIMSMGKKNKHSVDFYRRLQLCTCISSTVQGLFEVCGMIGFAYQKQIYHNYISHVEVNTLLSTVLG